MAKITLTERVKKLEEKLEKKNVISEKQELCLNYISILMDGECMEYATKQLTEDSDWIHYVDAKRINKDYQSEGVMVRKNDKMCVPTPSGKIKYNNHYFQKLEEMVFGEQITTDNKIVGFFTKFINKFKKK